LQDEPWAPAPIIRPGVVSQLANLAMGRFIDSDKYFREGVEKKI
jgi:hypothetical protein